MCVLVDAVPHAAATAATPASAFDPDLDPPAAAAFPVPADDDEDTMEDGLLVLLRLLLLYSDGHFERILRMDLVVVVVVVVLRSGCCSCSCGGPREGCRRRGC